MLLQKCSFAFSLIWFVQVSQAGLADEAKPLQAQIATDKNMQSAVNLILKSSPPTANPMLKSKITYVRPKLIRESNNPPVPAAPVNPPHKRWPVPERFKPTNDSPNWGKVSQDLIELKANANINNAYIDDTAAPRRRNPHRIDRITATRPYTLTPVSGIICWQPDYDTKLVANNPYRGSRLDAFANLLSEHTVPELSSVGMLGLPAPMRSNSERHKHRRHTRLQSSNQVVSGEIGSVPREELAAEAKLLPVVQQDVAVSWDDWYKKVASVLYSEWKQKEVSAGSTIATITVFSDRKVSPLVLGFTDVREGRTSPRDQQQFRQTVLDLIKNLNQHQFWQFPQSNEKQITINVQFRKEVDGPIGCDIIR